MKRKFTHTAFVDDSAKLTLPRSLFEDVANHLRGRKVFVTIEDAAGVRSLDQNAYYHTAIVEPITRRFNELGERFDEKMVHEILKYKFLKEYKCDEHGEIKFEYVKSTAELKVYEFVLFVDDCIRYAAEDLELPIEPPRRRRSDYIFPIFAKDTEPREKYVKRVAKYLEDIFDINHLVRFFSQNDDWTNDTEIKSLFTARKLHLKTLK